MADIYVSSSGSNTSPYDTWAKAATSFATAVTLAAAGDVIHVASGFTQSLTSTTTYTFAGTTKNPVIVVVENTSTGAFVEKGATLASTSSSSVNVAGSVDSWGLNIEVGSGPVNARLTLGVNTANAVQRFHQCNLKALGTGTSARLGISQSVSAAGRQIIFDRVDVYAGGSSSSLGVFSPGIVDFEMYGGSIEAPSFVNIVEPNVGTGRGSRMRFFGVDMSACPSGLNFMRPGGSSLEICEAYDCRMPSGWSGAPFDSAGTPGIGQFADMWNCGNSSAKFAHWSSRYAGSVKSNTGVYADSGASVSSVGYSLEMLPNAAAALGGVQLNTPWFGRWEATTGSQQIDVEIAHAGSNLTNAQVWLEVRYMSQSGYPLGPRTSNRVASPRSTPVAHDTSSHTWIGSGTGTKQKLSVTVNPQREGYFQARVVMSDNPVSSLFVDPILR